MALVWWVGIASVVLEGRPVGALLLASGAREEGGQMRGVAGVVCYPRQP